MTTTGKVRTWHAEEGWGVLDSAETPGGCWAHFSAITGIRGYQKLDPGQVVAFDWEPAQQDGYSYRAVLVRPAGRPPEPGPAPAPSDVYWSRLVTWEEPAGGAWRRAVGTAWVRLKAALRPSPAGRSRRGRRRRSGP